MKLIKPEVEIIHQEPGLLGVYKNIEIAGRTCYKSEDKITEVSAKKFVDDVIVSSGHTAMLEHGTIYLSYSCVYEGEPLDFRRYVDEVNYFINKYKSNPYSVVTYGADGYHVCITTNYRVLLENGWLDDLQYQCEPEKEHEKRITVKFICDRGVSHEFVRHRVFSFAQESTRYCNYCKDKFNNEVTFIQPCWSIAKTYNYHGVDNFDGDWFEHSLRDAEKYYFKLIELGWKPQQARAVLPNALKTELVMTGTVLQWKEFFKLRCDKNKAHPDAYYLAKLLEEKTIAEELI